LGEKDMEETDLITAALQGDLEAFNQLVLRYQDTVYTHAYYLLNDQAAAEDISQEAFILAFQKLSQYRGGSFRVWLIRIAANACYDEIRRWKRKRQIPLVPLDDDGDEVESPYWVADQGPSVEEIVERDEFGERVQSLLDELPFVLKTAVLMIDIQEMDYAEAAQALGIPMGTLKSRLVRGRLKLRSLLEGSGLFERRDVPASVLVNM
jgi:RNA polymerase sigma-70 factor, ECF subfamily